MVTAEKCLYYVLDGEGKPVPEPDLIKWAKCFETSPRLVRHDALPNGVSVTTVFLAVDSSWSIHDPPILWGTMIKGGSHDNYEERYTSREDALMGHEEALALASGMST